MMYKNMKFELVDVYAQRMQKKYDYQLESRCKILENKKFKRSEMNFEAKQ